MSEYARILEVLLNEDKAVAAIVETFAESIAINAPSETLEEYLAGNAGQSYNIDIANDG